MSVPQEIADGIYPQAMPCCGCGIYVSSLEQRNAVKGAVL